MGGKTGVKDPRFGIYRREAIDDGNGFYTAAWRIPGFVVVPRGDCCLRCEVRALRAIFGSPRPHGGLDGTGGADSATAHSCSAQQSTGEKRNHPSLFMSPIGSVHATLTNEAPLRGGYVTAVRGVWPSRSPPVVEQD